ncbi:hypothetical protein KP509_05G053700 [Ceratopteris richardii]|uniref:WW domain-containing protein n=1 Tax=Ceratopteris richardii TaxID=49495 RepID=A0A8T2UUF7_CERRI|nr:hypothetical protein KP509_05G053700 [Ceratopteris richardii]
MDTRIFYAGNTDNGFASWVGLRDSLRGFAFLLQGNRSWRHGLRLAGLFPSAAAAYVPHEPSLTYEINRRFSSFFPPSSTFPAPLGEKREKVYTARDIALGVIDVQGWSVDVDGKGEVGKVVDILYIGTQGAVDGGVTAPYEYILKVVRPCFVGERSGRHHYAASASDPYRQFVETEIKILIPIVDEFIQQINFARKRLLVKPPSGLLELAERPEAILKLEPEIKLFCKRYARFLQERFIGGKKQCSGGNIDLQKMVHSYMPTREQMYSVGRSDLVRQVQDAGGFLYVANVLGLKATRRPNGFWDDLQRLDFEIECFLLESWVKHTDVETGQIYFKNYVTNEVSFEKPMLGRSSSPSARDNSSPDSHDDCKKSKVMPRIKFLAKAGRWDLHHAIVWNGGYREVARLLGRKQVRSSKKSRKKSLAS